MNTNGRPRDDSTTRFGNRVSDYIRYRPGYPDAVWDHARAAFGLYPQDIVADLGSGTGLLSRLFLVRGHRVHGVEPNGPMREAGEELLSQFLDFNSVDGTAEATGLADDSVDLVTAGQAFHWFDSAACRDEALRILRPRGVALLVWNERRSADRPLLAEYDRVLSHHVPEHRYVAAGHVGEEHIAAFFGSGGYEEAAFPNVQHLDRDGLIGRLMSSSYAPKADDPRHDALVADMSRVFDDHQQGGKVAFEYDCRVFTGRPR